MDVELTCTCSAIERSLAVLVSARASQTNVTLHSPMATELPGRSGARTARALRKLLRNRVRLPTAVTSRMVPDPASWYQSAGRPLTPTRSWAAAFLLQRPTLPFSENWWPVSHLPIMMCRVVPGWSSSFQKRRRARPPPSFMLQCTPPLWPSAPEMSSNPKSNAKRYNTTRSPSISFRAS